MKSVIKGSYKANVGAGAETKSFGSTTLRSLIKTLKKMPNRQNVTYIN
jgi:hypothetical protein